VSVTVRESANAVIVGAGIVGNSLAHHLALEGWTKIVLLDKGPMPNPGGSTGHASNFIFPVDHSKEMTLFTQESVRQYRALGVFTQSGGIEVARTPERLEELKRRMASAKAWGEEADMLSPREIRRKVPFINEEILLGGFFCPGVGVVDSLRAGTLMREHAQELDALDVFPNTEVLGIDVEHGRVRGIRTSRGAIRTDVVAICCGVWSPRIARMAGASIPLTPAVHQMIDVGPVPLFMDTAGEIAFPIIRDMDPNMYERQHGAELEIGSYAHRPILVDPDDIPSLDESALSPTQLPFTKEDFDPEMERALELMPEILSDQSVGIRLAINGLLSLTPDGFPILGESPEARGLWAAAAVWIKEAPGIAKTVAQWMTGGVPDIDPHGADIARFYDHQRTGIHVRARTAEGYNKTYGIVHPAEQWASNRDVRLSPFHTRERELGAVFFETAGWERPHWYESNRTLLDEYGARVARREAEWDARWWSPIINAEHLAMRDRVGLIDLSAFAVFDITGRGALEYMQRMVVNQIDVAVGRVVYTPLLNEQGGIKADLTVMRLGAQHFRVVTGGALGMVDKKWLVDHLPQDGYVQLQDLTSAWCTLGVWGPRARDLVQTVTDDDVSHSAFPFGTCRAISIGPVRALASRISYVGELGWEVHAPMEQGQRLWDVLWEAGQRHGVVPVGIGVYGTTGRLEKSYRSYGNELEQEYNLVETGLGRPSVKPQEFIGKSAYLRQRQEQAPAANLCTLVVDSNRSASGANRYMLGREPILTPEGQPLVDRKGRRSYVTSAGAGPSIGKHLLMAFLPPDHAVAGRRLAVEYFGERYPVSVAVAGNVPLFDPENLRMKR
jgi:glycine cleavage system aminomethyltransferase T/glycine/D-amino acid oxidase-like deaminating enzyme